MFILIFETKFFRYAIPGFLDSCISRIPKDLVTENGKINSNKAVRQLFL
jgi:hypothetical protein